MGPRKASKKTSKKAVKNLDVDKQLIGRQSALRQPKGDEVKEIAKMKFFATYLKLSEYFCRNQETQTWATLTRL